MRRRRVLRWGGVSAVALLAGCTGTPSPDQDDGNYTRVRDREGELDEDAISIESIENVEPDTTEEGHPIFHGVVRNEGDVLAENVEIELVFYDADGSVLFTHTTAVGNIGPGSIERIHLPFPSGVAADDVKDYELNWSETDEYSGNGSDH